MHNYIYLSPFVVQQKLTQHFSTSIKRRKEGTPKVQELFPSTQDQETTNTCSDSMCVEHATQWEQRGDVGGDPPQSREISSNCQEEPRETP